MADQTFLEFVAKADGFRHGEEEFRLISLALTCRGQRVELRELNDTTFLLNSPAANLRTYHRQSSYHGSPLVGMETLQHRAPRTVCSTLMEVQQSFIDDYKLPSPPIRVWCQAYSQCALFTTLCPPQAEIKNLLDTLACLPMINPGRLTTVRKGGLLARWLDDKMNYKKH